MRLLCRYEEQPPLDIPLIAFDGTRDFTIPRGFMAQWAQYTTGRYRSVAIKGDHYFVSTHFREVRAAGRPTRGQGRGAGDGEGGAAASPCRAGTRSRAV